MKGIIKCDDRLSPGVVPCDLHGIFDGLGTAVGQHDRFLESAGDDIAKLLCQPHRRFEDVEDINRRMNEDSQ